MSEGGDEEFEPVRCLLVSSFLLGVGRTELVDLQSSGESFLRWI